MRISSAAGFAPHVGQSRQFCTASNNAPKHYSILTLGFILCFYVVKEGSIHISKKIGFILSLFAHSTTQKPTSMPALPHPPLPVPGVGGGAVPVFAAVAQGRSDRKAMQIKTDTAGGSASQSRCSGRLGSHHEEGEGGGLLCNLLALLVCVWAWLFPRYPGGFRGKPVVSDFRCSQL